MGSLFYTFGFLSLSTRKLARALQSESHFLVVLLGVQIFIHLCVYTDVLGYSVLKLVYLRDWADPLQCTRAHMIDDSMQLIT